MDYTFPKKITIPPKIEKYIEEHDGVALVISINSASADAGYAHLIHTAIELKELTRTCHRCGYDPCWNPDDSESKCARHTYGAERYDTVFSYSPTKNDRSLAECFDEWLSLQDKTGYGKRILKSYGKYGWSN